MLVMKLKGKAQVVFDELAQFARIIPDVTLKTLEPKNGGK